MKPSNSSEIRQAFLDFFEEMGHQVVDSAPLPQFDNPTLLFTNAGMNQFVDVFLGKEVRSYKRAATSQKCMRVQGKHNDLENVGPSGRHHTFFEMLGNFSFGDYFKKEGIRYAYDFITKVCQISEDRLWYTVHVEDDQAYDIWATEIGVNESRILRMGDETNFWMMGDVGPCGPTSEIHYDWGPEYCTCGEANCGVSLDNDCDRWLEVWNLVFMEFDQKEDGRRIQLPKPGVDTGMGLERITAIVENRPVNYDTDLFKPAMDRIQEMLEDSESEREEHETGYRVIADHGRAAAFLIADGVLPGNVGRGYVLRMIIRRAARFGRSIGFSDSFLGEISNVYINLMADYYPELRRHQEHILHTIALEEKRFSKTLDAALNQLEVALSELHQEQKNAIPGTLAFDLYATHGLPLEITRDVAQEHGFKVDERGFLSARQAHAKASGAGAFGQYELEESVYSDFFSEIISRGLLDSNGVDHDPYSGSRLEAPIVGLFIERKQVSEAGLGDEIEIITAATPFYVEAGGEVSDTGYIHVLDSEVEISINDVRQVIPGLIVHQGKVEVGTVKKGQLVELIVDNDRRWDIRRNHTATHLLHHELRAKLGNHVTQQGSLVSPDHLRFDFSYGEPVNRETLNDIEWAINQAILANMTVAAEYMPLKEATKAGAMALFGEKYGDIVRTIRVGSDKAPYSFELCGGLHVNATGDIGIFKFTTEEAVGAGLRRVEAVTGKGAYFLLRQRQQTLENVGSLLKSPINEIAIRVEALLAENKATAKELNFLRRERARQQFESLISEMVSIDGISIMAGQVDASSFDTLREMSDWFRDRVSSGIAVFGAVKEERPILIAAVTDDLVEKGVSASQIIGPVARIVGGGGGGRPALAQAGGSDPSKLVEALEAVPRLVADLLSA
ncbi:MAG: alanine--tRNA ligase [Anaerolineae bacterium]|nr:MAG: alanine--tRNA ligase [Anaerolineae bacterium]